jgi:sugar lactone lactonase YvrE
VTENYASLSPATALCCKKPEGILAFDMKGNLVHHWNQSDPIDGHLILADREGNIWIGSDTMRKYDKNGKLLATLERVPDKQNPKPGTYPADEPRIVGRIEGGEFDENARELFVTDSYLRGRILVYDMDTLKFKRGWAAYGKPLKDINFVPNAKYDPKGPPAKEYLGHLTLTVSRDGFVYAADRVADRIQVYTKAGKFVKEFTVAPETLDRGSTGGMALSPDQKFMYVSDIMNNVVWIVDRMSGKTLGHFGFFGHSGGGFHWLHMVATDQHGNVYTGEVDTGKRVQRFVVSN